jgi:cell division protein FtsN
MMWVASAVAVAAILLGGVMLFGTGDNGARPEAEAERTTESAAPPIRPATRSEETKPGKPAGKEGQRKPEENQHQTKPTEPRFSFYKILPEKEVIIPESEIKAIKREEGLARVPPGQSYLLQAGSFSSLQDAERLKAQLSQLKVKSKIESVKIENAVWHRVKIGPFSSLVDADKVRAYLRNNQIDSVVQKATGK